MSDDVEHLVFAYWVMAGLLCLTTPAALVFFVLWRRTVAEVRWWERFLERRIHGDNDNAD